MAAIFGPGGPIILPWTVRGDHFRGGTVHGVTGAHKPSYHAAISMLLSQLTNGVRFSNMEKVRSALPSGLLVIHW